MPDKTIIIRTFITKTRRSNETEEQWTERLMQKNPRSLSYAIIDDSQLPASREFRGAWEGEISKPITINEAKKQDIIDARLI